MTDLNVFAFDSQAVRVVMVDGEPWFAAADVCAILGFGNPRQAIESHVDAEDVQKLDTLTAGGTQQTNHVNESGLYALIFGSTKPEAKRFKRWVTHEVLPSIRKTGAYIDPKAPGAMGVQTQPMPYLSHVADFHVAADRVFRSALRSARSSGVPLPSAIRKASAVTQAKTGLNMIELLDVHEHLQVLDAREAADADAPRHAGAARFWHEWAGGELEGLPYQSCLAAQAYQAYTHWCSLMREGETARREVFTATVIEAAAQAGQAVRVKPMRIGVREGGSVERVLLVSPPPLEGQGAWATALVAQFAEHLRAYLAQKRSGDTAARP